jgi:probable HAF family extracellular repeat protein
MKLFNSLAVYAVVILVASITGLAQTYQRGAKPMTYRISEIAIDSSSNQVTAFDLNDTGNAVGDFGTSPTSAHGFLRNSDGNVTLTPIPSRNSNRKINSLGEVAGSVFQDGDASRAFRWNGNENPAILGLGDSSRGFGINNLGDVVGSVTAAGYTKGFIWDRNGSTIEIGTLDGSPQSSTTAYAVNDNRLVAGMAVAGDGAKYAFIWTPDVQLQKLFPQQTNSAAFAVNNWGRVAGYVQVKGGTRAFIFDSKSNEMNLYGSITGVSAAYSINYSGAAVGESDGKAVLFLGLKAYDLNALVDGGTPWTLTTAYAINNSGQIAVVGTLKGATRSFLLTPIQ